MVKKWDIWFLNPDPVQGSEQRGIRPVLVISNDAVNDNLTIFTCIPFSSVKPGITGLWQASGRSDTDYAERVALDRHYVLNWSPWMDLWIVIKTVFAVLRMRGSY